MAKAKDVDIFIEKFIKSKNAVFFGGAGVSTESGIPDFRSADGLYNAKYEYPPETILSHSFFNAYPQKFFEFYRDKMIYLSAKPNVTHVKLAQAESVGIFKAVITQNIDGLHQKAGSKRVYELHGSIYRNTCTKCGKKYGLEVIVSSSGVPKCDSCGGIIKPDVVLYEEPLDGMVLNGAINAIKNADMLVVGGTSLAVYPAAGLLQYFNGDCLALINKKSTPYDRYADICIDAPLGEVFGKMVIR